MSNGSTASSWLDTDHNRRCHAAMPLCVLALFHNKGLYMCCVFPERLLKGESDFETLKCLGQAVERLHRIRIVLKCARTHLIEKTLGMLQVPLLNAAVTSFLMFRAICAFPLEVQNTITPSKNWQGTRDPLHASRKPMCFGPATCLPSLPATGHPFKYFTRPA